MENLDMNKIVTLAIAILNLLTAVVTYLTKRLNEKNSSKKKSPKKRKK